MICSVSFWCGNVLCMIWWVPNGEIQIHRNDHFLQHDISHHLSYHKKMIAILNIQEVEQDKKI